MVDNAPLPGHSARLAADRATAEKLADFLTESLDDQGIAISAFESGAGWNVALYFERPPNQTAIRALIALQVGADLANTLTFERIEAKDWVAASLEGLKPVAAGRFLVHGRHDRLRVPANRIGVEIEAALAFGTGHHGTTRGCLLALDFIARQPRNRRPRVLDLGTGTGVLAIAAAKAFKTRVLASDVDPRALLVARDNARLNCAAPRVEFIHAAGVQAGRFRTFGPFDLILANILLAPLVRLARPMRRLLAPGGRVVLSGLLSSHAQAALLAYRAQGLVLERRILLDEWTTLVLRRPALPR